MGRDRLRIGCGAGFSGDRIDPAVALAQRGALDYLVFECLAERTIALAVRARAENPERGFDPHLKERLGAVLAHAARNGVRIISNMGAAHPVGAIRAIAEIARAQGIGPLRIAAVTGDDVLSHIQSQDHPLLDGAGSVRGRPGHLISANAYIGAEPIARALAEGADIVITGRVADPSLFLAPMIHEFGWSWQDWDRLGQGTLVGHLMECAGQITGGYFADPGMKEVSRLADLGFPFADVSEDGSASLSKLPGTGGCITLATCKEQLLYELHDPSSYLTPDVTADFSGAQFHEVAPDTIAIVGGRGRARPERLKVSLGYQEGYMGEGQITYAGPGAVERGRLALAIVEERLKPLREETLDLRLDLIGVDSVLPGSDSPPGLREVRARVSARMRTMDAAARVGREVEALYTNGPAGGGGVSQLIKPVIAVTSTLISRDAVKPMLHWEHVK